MKHALRLTLIFILGLFAYPLEGQSTNVTITVTSPPGQVWLNGTVSYKFKPTPNFSGNSQWQGADLPGNYLVTTTLNLDSGGTAGFALPSNTAITPAGSMWTIVVCPQATVQCVSTDLAVTGTTQDISSTVNANLRPITVQGLNVPLAYTDPEITTTVRNGAIYINTTTEHPRYFNGSIWQDFGTGGGGTPPAGFAVVQYSNLAGTAFVSGATIDTDLYNTGNNGPTNAQTQHCTTLVCDLFTPSNSTDGAAGTSLLSIANNTSNMWNDRRGNRDAWYFLNPQMVPSFPTFGQEQAAFPEQVTYTLPPPGLIAGAQQSAHISYNLYQAPGYSNGNNGCPLFCPPPGYTSNALWQIINDVDRTVQINSAGIGNSNALLCNFWGIGDHQCGLGGVFVNYAGGAVAPSDEDEYGLGSIHNATQGDAQGTMTTRIDDNHIKLSMFTNNKALGQGRYVLDFSNVPKDAHGATLSTTVPVTLITSPSNGPPHTPGFVTLGTTDITDSTAVGNYTNDCTVQQQLTGVSVGQNSGVNGCAVTLVSGQFCQTGTWNGSSCVGSTVVPVCSAYWNGNLHNLGMEMVSAPSTPSAGHQTIFATMHRSVPLGGWVFQGGACGWGLNLNGDVKIFQTLNNTTMFGGVIPIIGSFGGHNLYYALYNASQDWTTLPLNGSQWGSQDTGNNPGSHGFFFSTLTRISGVVTGVTFSHGQNDTPGWQMLLGTKFFSVTSSDPSCSTFVSTGVNAFMGMPGPEVNRVTYGQAGPDAVCTNAVIAMQNTTVGPVFFAEVLDVINHANGLSPADAPVDGTLGITYQPNFLVGDVMDSPPHPIAGHATLRMSDEMSQPQMINNPLWISANNVASYNGNIIRIDTFAQFPEVWGSGGLGFPSTALSINGYIGDIIQSTYAPAPTASVISIGFPQPNLANHSIANSSFRNYNLWCLNAVNPIQCQNPFNYDSDTQTYSMQYSFGSGGTAWKWDPLGNSYFIPTRGIKTEFLLNQFPNGVNPVTEYAEGSIINGNGVIPVTYRPFYPSSAVITQSGTAGTTTYNYVLLINDVAGLSSPDATYFTFTGATTLNGTNFNNIPCTDLPSGKTGTIYILVNPIMAAVGSLNNCTNSATVVHDTGSYVANVNHLPAADGGIHYSGGYQTQGATGFYAFSDTDVFANPYITTASFSQPTNGTVFLNGATVGDHLGNFELNNIIIHGTCTGCTGGGGGTVNSFSAGNLNPLFNTSVANPTTNPALSFTLNSLASFISVATIPVTLGATSIPANDCSTLTGTNTMTGVTAANSFAVAFATDPAAVVGWGASGGLVFTPWPTTNTLNWKVCNQTSSTINSGAITLNVGVR